MGNVRILSYTQRPLELIGEVAAVCWNSKPSEKIARHCLKVNHARTFEYADIVVELSGYSARAIRELYTHVAGTTKLQESTRYVDYSNMEYFTPPILHDLDNMEAKTIYDGVMSHIQKAYTALIDIGIHKEDVANILPLGSMSRVVLKINARALIHFAHMRSCTRAYHEIRRMTADIQRTILDLSGTEDGKGWELIAKNMVPKCIHAGYCDEAESCGVRPLKKDVLDKANHACNCETPCEVYKCN